MTARSERDAAAGPVGFQSLGVLVLVAAFWVTAFVLLNPWATWDSVLDHAGASAIFGAIMGVLLLIGTARVFVRSDRLYLVSLAVTHVVPIQEIASIVDDNGFGVRVVSGRTFGSVAFGPSVIALITRNRRGRRAARRLRSLNPLAEEASGGWQHDTVRTQPRTLALSLAVAMVALMPFYAISGTWI